MAAHFAIRTAAHIDPPHEEYEWVVLVAGNGEALMATETYPSGHGNARRAVQSIIEAAQTAGEQWRKDYGY